MATLIPKGLPTANHDASQTANDIGNAKACPMPDLPRRQRELDEAVFDAWEAHNTEERMHPERHDNSRGPHRLPTDD